MDLLKSVVHRPWPLPSKNWIMRQGWRNVLFVHYPVRTEQLRPHIPSFLEIDTFNGVAWLSVVIFMMEGIYPRGLSFMSLTPPFLEVNVRTYVHNNGQPGIFFMSLDVDNWASYTIAKRWYRLPYQRANIHFWQEGESFYCQSVRREEINSEISFEVKYTPSSEVYISKEGTLDHWLSERYCLYSTNGKGNLYIGEIHHHPWPLQNVRIEIIRNFLFPLFKRGDQKVQPICHYSKGIDTLFWNIKKRDK